MSGTEAAGATRFWKRDLTAEGIEPNPGPLIYWPSVKSELEKAPKQKFKDELDTFEKWLKDLKGDPDLVTTKTIRSELLKYETRNSQFIENLTQVMDELEGNNNPFHFFSRVVIISH